MDFWEEEILQTFLIQTFPTASFAVNSMKTRIEISSCPTQVCYDSANPKAASSRFRLASVAQEGGSEF